MDRSSEALFCLYNLNFELLLFSEPYELTLSRFRFLLLFLMRSVRSGYDPTWIVSAWNAGAVINSIDLSLNIEFLNGRCFY